MFNNLGQLADLMRNAGRLRETVEKATESLGQVQVEGAAGGGVVTARVNGRMEVVSVRIDPKLVADGDIELLEDLIASAVNQGLTRAPRGRGEVDRVDGRQDLPLPGGLAGFLEPGVRPRAGELTTMAGVGDTTSGAGGASDRGPRPPAGRRQLESAEPPGPPPPEMPARGGPRPGRRHPGGQGGGHPPLPRLLLPPDRVREPRSCSVCRDPRRDASLICVVEQPRDLMALEKSGGLRLASITSCWADWPRSRQRRPRSSLPSMPSSTAGCGRAASARSSWPPTRTLRGTGTAMFVARRLAESGVPVTRLARGLCLGRRTSKFANKEMLSDAIQGRWRF